LEKLRPGDPPSPQDLHNCRARLKDFVAEQIAPALEGVLLAGASARDGGASVPASRTTPPTPGATLLVGTGGTTTILARMEKQMNGFDRDAIEGTIITRERIVYWMEKLWALSLAQRREIRGVPPRRADIIPMGVAIYEAMMERFDFAHLFVSTRGLRFGALMQDNE
jgi:exopolyphosphatase/guanosine-5'-triphosphate,3'-diphosphate pyrophosphatase